MKRSAHTAYETNETQIYEYKGNYFILQMCQQGKILNPAHGSKQLASDFCALSCKISIDSSSLALGDATLIALNDFDVIGHPFDQFDIPARNKIVASWFGARGMGSLEKNCRVVQIIENLQTGSLSVIPFDNHVINDWNGPIEGGAIDLAGRDAESLGNAVKAAFLVATYHPDRKDPMY